MALLTSPTIGAMAQHSFLLPAKIQAKETEASVTLPYTNKLNSLADFNKMTVVDANNDGTTWQFSDHFNMAAYAFNTENAADDWLISPAFNAKKGAIYKFSFDATNSYPTERVAASVGNAPTAEGMTTEVIDPTDITYKLQRTDFATSASMPLAIKMSVPYTLMP